MANSTDEKVIEEEKAPEEKKIPEETKTLNLAPVVQHYNNPNAVDLFSKLSIYGDENLKIDDKIVPRLFDH